MGFSVLAIEKNSKRATGEVFYFGAKENIACDVDDFLFIFLL